MSADHSSVHRLLSEHVPSNSVEYCIAVWDKFRFDLRLRKKRITKIGDFCFHGGSTPRITINNDLAPHLFLTTYLHEVAHLDTHLRYGRKAEAHGVEWKKSFQEILFPVLNADHYPQDLLEALNQHMKDPMATTYSDPSLMSVFRKYDHRAGDMTLLSEIPRGSIFELRGRWFRKEETKRTRVLCLEVKTKRKYLVPADAAVNNIQLSLL